MPRYIKRDSDNEGEAPQSVKEPQITQVETWVITKDNDEDKLIGQYEEFILLWNNYENHPAFIREFGRIECFRGWLIFHSDPDNFEEWLSNTKRLSPIFTPCPVALSSQALKEWDKEQEKRKKRWVVLSR